MSFTQPRTDWPRQIRLAGQTPPVDGPVDLTMMYLMHHAFRRDLTAFTEAVPATPVTDRAAWVAMQQRWETFSHALHHHHSGEDAWLWPALAERTDDAGRETLVAMEAEHDLVDPALAACAEGLAGLVAGAGQAARDRLAIRMAAALQLLEQHLEHEEQDAITILQSVLSQSDWDDIDEKFQKGLGFGELLTLVPWALHEVPAEVRGEIFAQPGGGVHRLMWLLTRRRFDRQDRAAFVHRPRA